MDADRDIKPKRSQADEEAAASDWSTTISGLSLGEVCGPCRFKDEDIAVKPGWYCNSCDDYLCEPCMLDHKAIKATRNHVLTKYEKNVAHPPPPCGPCGGNVNSKISLSIWYCQDCNDYLCDDCSNHHRALKLTRSHIQISVKDMRKAGKALNPLGLSAVDLVPLTFEQAERSGEDKIPSKKRLAPKPFSERTAKLQRTFNVQLPEDEKLSNLADFAFMSGSYGSRLLLIDTGNNCLKVFQWRDSELRFAMKKKLDHYGRLEEAHVAVRDQREIAVKRGYDIKLMCINEKDIRETGSIISQFFCTDLAFISRDRLAVLSRSPAMLSVISVDGTEVWSLMRRKNQASMDLLFPKGMYVAVNRELLTAYVVDANEQYVLAVNLAESGDILYSAYFGRPLSGIAVDRDGIVYVSENMASKIHIISEDGSRVRVLLDWKDGLVKPKALSISPDGMTLFVVSERPRVGDKIQVYRLE